MNRGVAAYASDVRERRFPDVEHTYSIPDDELAQFLADLDAVRRPLAPAPL